MFALMQGKCLCWNELHH